jgi:hypothetical protein
MAPLVRPPASDLVELLRSLKPQLNDGVYCFVVAPAGIDVASVNPIATFAEAEGLTLIVEESVARAHGLAPLYRAAWITLTVHSDLNAVGLTAAVFSALAGAGISCNVVAAVHHDHLFVPVEKGAEAVAILERLG